MFIANLANIAGGVVVDGIFIEKCFTDTETIITHEVLEKSEDFFCLSVDTGAFVVKYNDVISITGNCHSEGGSWTFRTHAKEENRSKEEMDKLHTRIKEAALKIYEHECRIIEMMYEKGDIEGLKKEDFKIFVASRLNICLGNLGIEAIFDFDEETNTIATWFYDSINKFVFNDFFSGIGREYVRDWDEESFVWQTDEMLTANV